MIYIDLKRKGKKKIESGQRIKDSSELDKEAEVAPSSHKIVAVCKNETVHFVIGLMLVIFSVLPVVGFFFLLLYGGCRSSIIDSGSSADLAAVNNQVKNYAGSRGAQLASYLINDCFGISSFTCFFWQD